MQIVIDIPDEIKKQIDEGKAIELNIPLWLAYSIHIGIQLPKNHGRLIDADVLADGFEDNYEFCETINATPTIVSAHYEEDNNNDKV